MVNGARVLLSDKGAAFRSKLIRSLCSRLGIKQVFILSRHPQTNSRSESYNKNILNTHCNSEKNWLDLLRTIGYSFQTSVAKSLGISPYEIFFGQKPRLLIDDLLLPPKNLPKAAQCYFKTMTPQLQILRKTVRQNQLEAHQDTKRLHDARYTVRTPTFRVSGLTNKLHQKSSLDIKFRKKL